MAYQWWTLDTSGAAYIDWLSEGQADVYDANAGVSRVCFGVSDVQVDGGFDGAGHGLDVVRPPAHFLETGSDTLE